MPAPKDIVYAVSVHCSVVIPPPSERWIDGNAVTTTSASSVTMKLATQVSSTVSVCRELPVAGRVRVSVVIVLLSLSSRGYAAARTSSSSPTSIPWPCCSAGQPLAISAA